MTKLYDKSLVELHDLLVSKEITAAKSLGLIFKSAAAH